MRTRLLRACGISFLEGSHGWKLFGWWNVNFKEQSPAILMRANTKNIPKNHMSCDTIWARFFYFIGSLVQFFSSINAIYTNDGFFTRGMIQKCQISDWNYSSIENLIFEQCQIVLVTIDQIFAIYWVFKLITFIPPTSSLFEAFKRWRERERQHCQGEFSISRNPNNDNNISFWRNSRENEKKPQGTSRGWKLRFIYRFSFGTPSLMIYIENVFWAGMKQTPKRKWNVSKILIIVFPLTSASAHTLKYMNFFFNFTPGTKTKLWYVWEFICHNYCRI